MEEFDQLVIAFVLAEDKVAKAGKAYGDYCQKVDEDINTKDNSLGFYLMGEYIKARKERNEIYAVLETFVKEHWPEKFQGQQSKTVQREAVIG
jgi:hypothetical protein